MTGTAPCCVRMIRQKGSLSGAGKDTSIFGIFHKNDFKKCCVKDIYRWRKEARHRLLSGTNLPKKRINTKVITHSRPVLKNITLLSTCFFFLFFISFRKRLFSFTCFLSHCLINSNALSLLKSSLKCQTSLPSFKIFILSRDLEAVVFRVKGRSVVENRREPRRPEGLRVSVYAEIRPMFVPKTTLSKQFA